MTRQEEEEAKEERWSMIKNRNKSKTRLNYRWCSKETNKNKCSAAGKDETLKITR